MSSKFIKHCFLSCAVVVLWLLPIAGMAQNVKKDRLFGFTGKLRADGSLLTDSGRVITKDAGTPWGYHVGFPGQPSIDDQIKKGREADQQEKVKLQALKNNAANQGLASVVDAMVAGVNEDEESLRMLSKASIYANNNPATPAASQVQHGDEQTRKVNSACSKDQATYEKIKQFISTNNKNDGKDLPPPPLEDNSCGACKTTKEQEDADNALIASIDAFIEDLFAVEDKYIRFLLDYERQIAKLNAGEGNEVVPDCNLLPEIEAHGQELIYQLMEIKERKANALFNQYKTDNARLTSVLRIALNVARNKEIIGCGNHNNAFAEWGAAVKAGLNRDFKKFKHNDYTQLTQAGYLASRMRRCDLLGETYDTSADDLLNGFKFSFDIDLDTKIDLEQGGYWHAHIKASKINMTVSLDPADADGCVKLVPANKEEAARFTVLNSESANGGVTDLKYAGPSQITLKFKIYLPDVCSNPSKAVLKIENIGPANNEPAEKYTSKITGMNVPLLNEMFHYAFDPEATLASFGNKENDFVDDALTEEQLKKPLSENALAQYNAMIKKSAAEGKIPSSRDMMAIYEHDNGQKTAEDKRKAAAGKPDTDGSKPRLPLKIEARLNNNNKVAIDEKVDGKKVTGKPQIIYATATLLLNHESTK